MRTVWKYDISMADHTDIWIPEGAKLLHVGIRGGMVKLWVEVEDTATPISRRFILRGTGHILPDGLHHIGSVQDLDLPLVWHLFEERNDNQD